MIPVWPVYLPIFLYVVKHIAIVKLKLLNQLNKAITHAVLLMHILMLHPAGLWSQILMLMTLFTVVGITEAHILDQNSLKKKV